MSDSRRGKNYKPHFNWTFFGFVAFGSSKPKTNKEKDEHDESFRGKLYQRDDQVN